MRKTTTVFIICTFLLFSLGSCSRRIQIAIDPTTKEKTITIDDRMKDILESDLPADAKERAIKDLFDHEARQGTSWQDWLYRVGLGIATGFGVWQAKKAADKAEDTANKLPPPPPLLEELLNN
jgi:hypothetical protein